jgi:hypothetical protein
VCSTSVLDLYFHDCGLQIHDTNLVNRTRKVRNDTGTKEEPCFCEGNLQVV